MSFSQSDHRHMARALRLARRGLASTSPNPAVGCVIVNQGEVVGAGYHEFAGGPHAEINALEQAGSAARDATAYVTLEPCSHHGRTPPCAEALINAGIAAVGPARMGIFNYLQPLFTAAIAIPVLGETLAWYHPLALGLVALGIVISSRRPRASKDREIET